MQVQHRRLAGRPPTPERILEARNAVGASTTEAAALVNTHKSSWSRWERGRAPMNFNTFELFLIKTGQKPLEIFNKKGAA